MADLFCLAAVLAGLSCAPTSTQPLCMDGHPARRDPNLTYGGLPARHGYQRDHYIPPGLGGPDTAANVHYQRCDFTGARGRCEAGPARLKDDDEHTAEENMCSGEWPPQFAISWLVERWPLDAAHGFVVP